MKIESVLDIDGQMVKRIQGIFLVIFATACWSTGGVFITRIAEGSDLNPVGLAFWRDLTTSLALLAIVLVTRKNFLRVRRKDLPWLIGMGVVSIGIFHVLWNMNILINGLAVATVIQCNAPIFVTIVAYFLWDESLTLIKITAIVLSIIGTALIAQISGIGTMQITVTGLLVGLASAITYGSMSLFGKKLSNNYSPWTILTYAFSFGALTLLPFQFNSKPTTLLPQLGWLVALVFISTIGAYALYTSALRLLPASVASITSTTEVPFAAIVSYFALGERLDSLQILGAVLVVTGVVLVSYRRKNTKRINR